MVDNRGFMVTRSYTVGVTMMHRTGRHLASQRVKVWGLQGAPIWFALTPQCVQHSPPFLHTGLYNYYDDEKEKLQMVEMPLAHKLSSLIILMPHHVEPLERLEKLLTKEQLKTWMGKMQKKAVAISLPKGVVEVTHDLQVRARGSGWGSFTQLLSRSILHPQGIQAGLGSAGEKWLCPWEHGLETIEQLLVLSLSRSHRGLNPLKKIPHGHAYRPVWSQLVPY